MWGFYQLPQGYSAKYTVCDIECWDDYIQTKGDCVRPESSVHNKEKTQKLWMQRMSLEREGPSLLCPS